MNGYQRNLVETHMDVVKWVILKHIKINESVVGLGYDDLYQEGCAALCKAAYSFDGSVKFITYAHVVVKNALISYCRSIVRKNTGADLSLEALDTYAHDSALSVYDPVDRLLIDAELLELLESLKEEYLGTARLGIEALILKIKGYSGADMARMYGAKPTLVGAWISRAAKKLRQNKRFMAVLTDTAC